MNHEEEDDKVHDFYNIFHINSKEITTTTKIKYGVIVFLLLSFFIVEWVIGSLYNSLSLVSDAFHMLSDGVAFIIAYTATYLATRPHSSTSSSYKKITFGGSELTFGWIRVEIIGALINSSFMMAVLVMIAADSLHKFFSPEKIESPKLVVIVGCIGLVMNLVIMSILPHSHSHDKDETPCGGDNHSHSDDGGHSHSHSHDHSHKAILLHVISDIFGSILVVICAGLTWAFPKEKWIVYLDPSSALILVFLMAFPTIQNIKETSVILMQSFTPLLHQEIKNKIENIDGVHENTYIQIYNLNPMNAIASVHVVCENESNTNFIAESIRTILHKENIHFSTIEIISTSQNERRTKEGKTGICVDDCLFSKSKQPKRVRKENNDEEQNQLDEVVFDSSSSLTSFTSTSCRSIEKEKDPREPRDNFENFMV